MSRARYSLVFPLVMLLLSGCLGHHPRRGDRDAAIYVVHPGESLWAIAQKVGVPPREIAEMNGIDDPTRIFPGQRLRLPRHNEASQPRDDVKIVNASYNPEREGRDKAVPAAKRSKAAKSRAASRGDSAKSAGDARTKQRPAKLAYAAAPPPPRARNPNAKFGWPAKGVLYSKFGMREGHHHDGIDVAGPIGTPVVAAGDGKVVFAGMQRGYGNLILIDHGDGVITVYGHNHKNLVRTGQTVRQGDKIAEMGRTGKATGPHCHFEVRVNAKPQNPMQFLP